MVGHFRMRLASALASFFLVAWPSTGRAADPRITYLTRQLETGKDPRVKAQAALMLGNTNDPSVLQALCGGMKDGSELVRGAAAKALEQLGDLSAIDCLKVARNDPHPSAKAAISSALAFLEGIKNRKPEFYIALAPVVDKAGVPTDVLKLAEDRLRAKLRIVGAVLAPLNENKTSAWTVIKQKKLKGYLLMPELHSLPGGGIKLHMLCFTYPERALLGEVNVKASGGGPSDLIRALAPKVIDEAVDTFDWRT
jgi:hypothetical protein